MEELTLSERADAAIDRVNARYTLKNNVLQAPPATGIRIGHDNELFLIDTPQGTYKARNLSTAEPGNGDAVALNVTRGATATFTVIGH
jgi:hypothetical protein